MNKKTAKKSLAGMVLLAGALMMTTSAGAAPAKPPTSPKAIIPTVFVHGLNGGDESMSEIMEGFTGIKSPSYKRVNIYSEIDTRSIQYLRFDGQEKTYVVLDNSDVKTYKFKGGKPGVVKVIFFNPQGNISKNSIYINNAMDKIEKDYGNKWVNLVGHSMGGITSANFAVERNSKLVIAPKAKFVQVKKLVTIGSPFEGSKISYKSKDYKIGQSLFQNLVNGGAEVKSIFGSKGVTFNKETKVLSLASKDDGYVSVKSAFGLEDYKKALPSKNLKKVYTTGGHSSQMYKTNTIKEVKNFLKD